MKKFIILLSLLILLPLTAASKPLIPIMKTLFTDVTGTVPDAEEIAHKAELFRQQTGIAPFIVVLPDINNEASLRQNGKAMLAHASSSLSDVKGSVLLLFTTREPRLIMITNGQVESGLDDKHLGLLIENHTLAYLNADLWYQGINNALAVLQAQILKQSTPPLTYYPHPGQQHENAPPGSTNTLGFIAWAATFILFSRIDPKSVTSWADLWKPEYKGSLLLTDDAREVFQMALRKLGYSGNTTDPKEIEAAYNELKKLMPNVAAFNSDNPANPYMEGEVNLGMIWNGSAFVARQAGTPIDVVWPKEGGIFWMDSLAIPANAKNKEGALKLINFLLRPDVAKQVAETIGYPTPNLAARKLLSPEVANDKTLYPDAETIKNGEWQNDVGAASSIYEEYYQKLKAGR